MSWIIRLVHGVANRPLEAIECCIALILLFTGLWLVGPFYSPGNSTSAKVARSVDFPMYFGIFQIAISSILLYTLAKVGWPNRQRVRRAITFIMFCVLLFYSISNMLLNGLHRINWVTLFFVTLITGICHLRLKWEQDGNA